MWGRRIVQVDDEDHARWLPRGDIRRYLFLIAPALERSSCIAFVLVEWYFRKKSHNSFSVCFQFTFYLCSLSHNLNFDFSVYFQITVHGHSYECMLRGCLFSVVSIRILFQQVALTVAWLVIVHFLPH